MIKYAIFEGLRKFIDPTFFPKHHVFTESVMSVRLSCATLDCQFMTRVKSRGTTQPDKHNISNDEKCY